MPLSLHAYEYRKDCARSSASPAEEITSWSKLPIDTYCCGLLQAILVMIILIIPSGQPSAQLISPAVDADNYNISWCQSRPRNIWERLPRERNSASRHKVLPCSQRYKKLAWSMPLAKSDVGKNIVDVWKRPEFHEKSGVRDDQRRILVATDPRGRLGLKVNVPKGIVGNTRAMFAPLGEPGARAACLAFELFVPSDFKWGMKGGKHGYGLWGGRPGNVGGGSIPHEQTGWLVRNVRAGEERSPNYGTRLYSYALNRDAKRQANGEVFGTTSANGFTPKGRWLNVEQEIVMNDPGWANGYSRLWINGIQYAEMTNQIMSCGKEWAVRGLVFNEMWGGNPEDRLHQSPKAQHYWLGQYRIYTQ